MKSFGLSFFIVAVAFLSRYPFSGAEDIANARENLLAGQRTDFWGSFSPWFFSQIASNNWEILYGLLFASILVFSLALIFAFSLARASSRISIAVLVTISYFTSLFVFTFSRDSALLVFLTLAIGTFLFSYSRDGKSRFLLFSISLISMIVAFTFRPWLSISTPFLLFSFFAISGGHFKLRKASMALLYIALVVSPLLLDQFFHHKMKLVVSYPQQQVMIMDAASIACLSADETDSKRALSVLQPLSDYQPLKKIALCSQFYPQSWASVVFYGARDGEAAAIKMIDPGQSLKYSNFQRDWISLISSRIPSYVQTKLMLGSQFLLAGESPRFRPVTWKSILQSPFEISKMVRLYSVLPVLLLIFFLLLRSKPHSRYREFLLSVSAFYFTFIAISTIAFIGDNQRYILPASIILYLLTVLRKLESSHE